MYSPNIGTNPFLSMKQYEYAADQIVSNSTNIGSFGAGVAFQGTSGNVTFPAVPSRVYCYMRQQNSDRSYLTADAFASIQSVSIIWNNRSGLLASATASDLYNISAQNGLQMTQPQWNKYTGGVLCLEFGKDIPLPEDLSVGMQSSTQFQIQMNCTNESAGSVNFTLYVVYVLRGVMTLVENGASYTTSLISESDLRKTKASGPTLDDIRSSEPFGGALISGGAMVEAHGGGFLGRAFSLVKRAVQKVAPLIPAAVGIASQLGVPHAMEAHAALEGLGLKPEHIQALVGSGGARKKAASKAQYLSRLRQ
jgi:hypothetical protein